MEVSITSLQRILRNTYRQTFAFFINVLMYVLHWCRWENHQYCNNIIWKRKMVLLRLLIVKSWIQFSAGSFVIHPVILCLLIMFCLSLHLHRADHHIFHLWCKQDQKSLNKFSCVCCLSFSLICHSWDLNEPLQVIFSNESLTGGKFMFASVKVV